jgi:hypothetical protein
METNTPVLSTPAEQPDQPKLTNAQVVAAATNSPALADDTFTFGGRTFPILHLDYDSYLEFMAYLQPLLEGVASKFARAKGVSLPGIDLPSLEEGGFGLLMKFCKKDLPEMAALVCNQQARQNEKAEDKVTPEWVKKNARTPFELVAIVMKQIDKNKMISDFADFFVQIFPMMNALTGNKSPILPTE